VDKIFLQFLALNVTIGVCLVIAGTSENLAEGALHTWIDWVIRRLPWYVDPPKCQDKRGNDTMTTSQTVQIHDFSSYPQE